MAMDELDCSHFYGHFDSLPPSYQGNICPSHSSQNGSKETEGDRRRKMVVPLRREEGTLAIAQAESEPSICHDGHRTHLVSLFLKILIILS
jgi:hypothetical protein